MLIIVPIITHYIAISLAVFVTVIIASELEDGVRPTRKEMWQVLLASFIWPYLLYCFFVRPRLSK